LFKKILSKPEYFGIPVISIGNLSVGGSGKTPVTIEIAKLAKKPAIVLRGYGRKSSGLIVVKDNETIITDVETSGDEAMEYAKSLQNAIVIVSENRVLGIQKAKELRALVVLLDDGFGKFDIKKIDILLEPKITLSNRFCLPAGPYKCPYFMRNYADLVLKESEQFTRLVSIEDQTDRMLLVTSISNPSRLEPYLPSNIVGKLFFKDHQYFDLNLINDEVIKCGAKSLLVTGKDAVKLDKFGGKLSIMRLDIEFNQESLQTIKSLDGIE
jgi:tetraacyldisaccharide 4'-kinase